MTNDTNRVQCIDATQPRLVEPSVELHESFAAALREYHAEGHHADITVSNVDNVSSFAAWLEAVRVAGLHGTAECNRDRVPHRVLWWARPDEYLGRARINLELNDELTQFGGHIGYDVQPTARRRGHATALLAAALSEAGNLGLRRALLTCGPDNLASITVIERCGGVLESTSDSGRLRFWCETG